MSALHPRITKHDLPYPGLDYACYIAVVHADSRIPEPHAFTATSIQGITQWLEGYMVGERWTKHPDEEVVVTVIGQSPDGITQAIETWSL